MQDTNESLLEKLRVLRTLTEYEEGKYRKFQAERLAGILCFPGCTEVRHVRLTDDDEFVSAIVLKDESGQYTHFYPLFAGEDITVEQHEDLEDAVEITDEEIIAQIDRIYTNDILKLDSCFEEEYSLNDPSLYDIINP